MPTNYNCLEGCDATLPEVEFNDSCDASVLASEIEHIYVANADATSFTDWDAPTEWATRLNATATTTGNEIRQLTVIGDKPASAATSVSLSKQRSKKIDATHTINFDIDDVTQTNYDFARKMQCGMQKKIWYKIRGGKIFGGNSGIVATIDVNPVLGRGDEILKLTGTITWKAKQDPEMADAPF